jgi:hypothetical protein
MASYSSIDATLNLQLLAVTDFMSLDSSHLPHSHALGQPYLLILPNTIYFMCVSLPFSSHGLSFLFVQAFRCPPRFCAKLGTIFPPAMSYFKSHRSPAIIFPSFLLLSILQNQYHGQFCSAIANVLFSCSESILAGTPTTMETWLEASTMAGSDIGLHNNRMCRRFHRYHYHIR